MLPSNPDSGIPETMEKVFGNDLILEVILSHLIITYSKTICRHSIGSLRLVQKLWLRIINVILRKHLQPLFMLNPGLDKSTGRSVPDGNDGEVLNQFVDLITSSPLMDNGCSSLLSLQLRPQFFRTENHKSLSECFRKCGSRMLELELFVPINGGSLPCIFPPSHLSFPLLKKLTVHLTEIVLANVPLGNAYDSTVTISHLIHQIITGTEQLKDFCVPLGWNRAPAPLDFQYISLPRSLVHLDLTGVSRVDDVTLVTNFNKLPILQHLELPMIPVSYADGRLNQILDCVKRTLKIFTIRDAKLGDTLGEPTVLRFPKMEKLERLYILSFYCELEHGFGPLKKYLPNLKCLMLTNHTERMLQKWTEKSNFETVQTLAVEMVSDAVQEGRQLRHLPTIGINMATMHRLHMGFPNVQRLSISLSGAQTCGLKYMFMEMTLLKVLMITVIDGDSVGNTDLWDSLLIGTSESLAAGLRASPEFWEIVKIENDHLPSIRRLKELTTLCLDSNSLPLPPGQFLLPIISDLAFHYGFLKLPSLKDIEFVGRFVASAEMIQQCENHGKSVKHFGVLGGTLVPGASRNIREIRPPY